VPAGRQGMAQSVYPGALLGNNGEGRAPKSRNQQGGRAAACLRSPLGVEELDGYDCFLLGLPETQQVQDAPSTDFGRPHRTRASWPSARCSFRVWLDFMRRIRGCTTHGRPTLHCRSRLARWKNGDLALVEHHAKDGTEAGNRRDACDDDAGLPHSPDGGPSRKAAGTRPLNRSAASVSIEQRDRTNGDDPRGKRRRTLPAHLRAEEFAEKVRRVQGEH
jgi:hypothetical protein